jgi:eukaryotic-like serine/threonine-protein kinase
VPFDEDTLLDTTASPPSSSKIRLEPDGSQRYDVGPLIARGGMGEVRAAQDMRIEREVAVKLMRSELLDAATVKRFLREARVQGALEHPAVPPVYDLGVDKDGKPYFVMKRLAGTTLQDVIAAKSHTRRQLLARFVDVCFAIGFAHKRGVVHRDIKPSNIMFGEFGEVYVLDWGLARLGDEDDASYPSLRRARSESETATGDLLGTPGYMSPEQARGTPVTERADVFSLGCVLYEILTATPALPRGITALATTLEVDGLKPRKVDPDVSPELDDLCAAATAADPATRPTARELAEKLQAYLDGDRDTARRKELATEHVAAARTALAAGDDDEDRARAMREVGRALVFDPTNADAQELLSRLLIAPERVPAAAFAAADAERSASRRKVIREAAFTYVGFGCIACSLFTMPIRAVWPVVFIVVLFFATAVGFAWMARLERPLKTGWEFVVIGGNALLVCASGFLFGPLFVTPIVAIGSTTVFLSQPAGHSRWWIVILHGIAFMVPLVLELGGVLSSTFGTTGGQFIASARVLDLTPFSTGLLMTAAMVTQLAIAFVLMRTAIAAQIAAQNQVHAQQWYLEQLLPKTPAAAS